MARRVAAAIVAAVLLALTPVAGAQVWERAGLGAALLGRWETSVDFLGRVSGEVTPAGRYFQGLALLETGRPGPGLEALEALSRAGGPFSGAALERVVHVWFRRGAYAEIRRIYRSTRAERFQDPDRLHYEVGQSLYLLGDPSGAGTLLARVSGGRFEPYALHTRALIAFEAGRLDTAVGLLGEAVDRSRGRGGALVDRLRVTRGRILYQAAVGVGGLDEKHRRELLSVARAQFARVEDGSSQYPSALRGIGWCSLELGTPARALGAFEVAAGRDPGGSAEDLWAQGRVYQRSEFFDEAVDAYGRASRRALALAVALEGAPTPGGGPPVQPLPAGDPEIRVLLARLNHLEGRRGSVERALEHRAGRVGAAGGRVDEFRAGRTRRLEELDRMSEGVHVYLDGVGLAALVPLAQRGRLVRASALDQRVGAGLDRITGVVSALEASDRWSETSTELHRRLEGLVARMASADEALTDARRTFWTALKSRVALRETELTRAIAASRSRVSSLDLSLATAEGGVAAAVSGLGEAKRRVRVLGERIDHARKRAEALLAQMGAAADRAFAVKARERARRLRLTADAYELDQTQALHLLEAGMVRPRSGGAR